MDTDMDRFADLLASLLEKYADGIDLENLPDPPEPPPRPTD